MKKILRRRVALLITAVLLCAVPLWRFFTLETTAVFQQEQIMKDIELLTSSTFKGRGLGEEGQKKFEDFFEAAVKASHIPFEKKMSDYLIPKWSDGRGLILPSGKTLSAGKDLELWTDGPSGGLEWSGDLLFTGTDFFKVPEGILKDKLICVQANRLSEAYIETAIRAGAKGILYYSPGLMAVEDLKSVTDRKQTSIAHKTSSKLLIAQLNGNAYAALSDLAVNHRMPGMPYQPYDPQKGYYESRLVGVIPNVRADFPLTFIKTEVPTYIVTFKGRNSAMTSCFVTQWEGQGMSTSEDIGYPAAQKSAVSTSVLLDLGRMLKIHSSKNTLAHDVTLIFMGGATVHPRAVEKASQWLQDHYETSQIMILEGLGGKGTQGIRLDWDRYSPLSRIFSSQLIGNLKHYPTQVATGGIGIASNLEPYKSFYRPDNGVVSVTALSDGVHFGDEGRPSDHFDSLDKEKVWLLLPVLQGYVEKQVMGKMTFEFIKTRHLLTVAFFMLLVFGIGSLDEYCKHNSSAEAWRRLARTPLWKAFVWAASSLPAFLITLFFVGMILSLPQDFNVLQMGEATVASVSAYDIFEMSWEGFLSLILSVLSPDPLLWSEIGLYLKRSLILAGISMGISMGLGLIKGVADAWLNRGKSVALNIAGIALYAIPDVLIAFVGLVSVVYLSKVGWVSAVIDANTLRVYVMPVITLSIVPTLYIARIVTVALGEEVQRDYVHYLYYKGMSRGQIYWKHFLIVGLQKLLASSKSIIMLIFSNLLVVEYLFNYPGVMTNILDSAGQPVKIILLSLSLGLSFGVFQLFCRMLGQKLSPGRESL